VFATAGDPVGNGLVTSLARPGGNVTGLSFQGTDLAGKRLELLREFVPGMRRLAVLADAGNPGAALDMGAVQAGQMVHRLNTDIQAVPIGFQDGDPMRTCAPLNCCCAK
jgi:putative ABC transport system substrate-binding protein